MHPVFLLRRGSWIQFDSLSLGLPPEKIDSFTWERRETNTSQPRLGGSSHNLGHHFVMHMLVRPDMYAWQDPFNRIVSLAIAQDVPVSTPQMGEAVSIQQMHSGHLW